jgi:hypothetical protein
MMRSKRFYSKLPIPKLSSLIRIFRDGEQLLLRRLTRWLRRKSDAEEGGTDADAGWKRLLLGQVPDRLSARDKPFSHAVRADIDV